MRGQAGIVQCAACVADAAQGPLVSGARSSTWDQRQRIATCTGAVNLLFDKYYGIDDNGNGDNNDNDGGEGTTVIGARVLDGRTGHGEVARTSLHGVNCLC